MSINFSSPAIVENYVSDWERDDTPLDSTAQGATDIFLESVFKDDILPKKVADQFDLVCTEVVFAYNYTQHTPRRVVSVFLSVEYVYSR